MSWTEIKKTINSNFNKPLNEKLIDFSFPQIYVFENSTTFVPPKNGLYKIICVGAGYEDATSGRVGGAGGVAIKTMQLSTAQSYPITINTTNPYSASFNSSIIGNGSTGTDGGTASGGDFNYTGGNGRSSIPSGSYINGASVGVFINGLSDRQCFRLNYYNTVGSSFYFDETLYGGYGILGFGFGQAYASYDTSRIRRSPAGKAGVIIIPIDVN